MHQPYDPSSASEYDVAFMDFSQVLAHRIRSLVASIEGFTDLLTDTLATQEQRELALRIFEGTARIERVLSDLQTYSRPVTPVAIPLHVEHVLQELVEALEDPVGVEINGNGGDYHVEADPHLLRQVLLVLVQNALEATGGQGPVRLEVSSDRQVGQAYFDIWNPGAISCDMPEQQVFIPFYTTKAQNLGLGLSIARRIAEAHDGSLELVATSPDGTCFRLALPLAEDD